MAVKILTETNAITGTIGTVSALAGDVQGNVGAVKGAKSALDWKVQARGGIDGKLSGLISRLNRQEQLLRHLNGAAQLAASRTEERTRLLCGKASGISYTMPLMTAATPPRAKADLATAAGWMLPSVFGVSTLSATKTSGQSMPKWLRDFFMRLLKTIETINDALHPTKRYQYSGKHNYNNKDYSNYRVVDTFDPDNGYMRKDQHTVKVGKSTACMRTAFATAYSINHPDTPITPDDDVNQMDAYGNLTGPCKEKYASRKYASSTEETLKNAYDELYSGRAMVITLNGTGGSNTSHYVTAVGYSAEAEIKVQNGQPLTEADILIMDPADGKIKTIADMGNKYRVNGTAVNNRSDWPDWVMK